MARKCFVVWHELSFNNDRDKEDAKRNIETFDRLLAKAKAGNASAQYYLAEHLISLRMANRCGLRKFTEDKQRAIANLLKKAALQGEQNAQKQLSFSYKVGWGVPQDSLRSDMWLILSYKNNAVFFDESELEKAKENKIAEAMSKECLDSNYQKCY